MKDNLNTRDAVDNFKELSDMYIKIHSIKRINGRTVIYYDPQVKLLDKKPELVITYATEVDGFLEASAVSNADDFLSVNMYREPLIEYYKHRDDESVTQESNEWTFTNHYMRLATTVFCKYYGMVLKSIYDI